MSSVYLAKLTIDPTTGSAEPRFGAPSVPQSWEVKPLRTTPAPTWIMTNPSGSVVIATRCNSTGGNGLYMLRGDTDYLDSLDNDEVAPAKEIYRKALEGNSKALVAMRAWRWWRCDVTERLTQDDLDSGATGSVGDAIQRDGVTRELVTEGNILPDPNVTSLPWDLDDDGNIVAQVSASIRVRSMEVPTLSPSGRQWTMAGGNFHNLIEGQADRSGSA